MHHAEKAYQRWLDMRPVERLNVAPEEPGWLGKYPFSRVEQRGAGLLLRALPQSLRQEVVSRRTMSAAAMVFKVLTMYQPGGPAERQSLLNYLVEPKVNGNTVPGEVLAGTTELKLAMPDPPLLLRALDGMTNGIAKEGSQVHSLGVDVSPTQESIVQLAEFIQAEVEVMVASKPEEKGPKVKSMRQAEAQTPRKEGDKKVCGFFAGGRGCKMRKNCN